MGFVRTENNLYLVFHKDQEIQEILSWFCLESRQNQNKKLKIDFKIRQEIVIKTKIHFLTISQEIF